MLPSRQDIQQGQVGFMGDEPDAGLPLKRLAQLGAEASRLRMLGSEAENSVVALEEHTGSDRAPLPTAGWARRCRHG